MSRQNEHLHDHDDLTAIRSSMWSLAGWGCGVSGCALQIYSVAATESVTHSYSGSNGPYTTRVDTTLRFKRTLIRRLVAR